MYSAVIQYVYVLYSIKSYKSYISYKSYSQDNGYNSLCYAVIFLLLIYFVYSSLYLLIPYP